MTNFSIFLCFFALTFEFDFCRQNVLWFLLVHDFQPKDMFQMPYFVFNPPIFETKISKFSVKLKFAVCSMFGQQKKRVKKVTSMKKIICAQYIKHRHQKVC